MVMWNTGAIDYPTNNDVRYCTEIGETCGRIPLADSAVTQRLRMSCLADHWGGEGTRARCG